MFNSVGIMGRLGQNPELKYTGSGVPFVSVSLAVERDRKNQSTGEREVDWVNCIAWRHTAMFIEKHFAKGQLALVQGHLRSRKWTDDKSGDDRYAMDVVVDEIYFAGPPRQTQSETPNEPFPF